MTSGEPVSIRKLNGGGNTQTGTLHDSNGNVLRIGMAPDSKNPEFKPADLVEITCPQTLYLAEVLGREGELLTVSVEHSIDRASLSAIQQVWYRPESE